MLSVSRTLALSTDSWATKITRLSLAGVGALLPLLKTPSSSLPSHSPEGNLRIQIVDPMTVPLPLGLSLLFQRHSLGSVQELDGRGAGVGPDSHRGGAGKDQGHL